MDTTKLTRGEVKRCIQEVKHALHRIELAIPLGRYRQDEEVMGEDSGIRYRYHAYRGIIATKYSLHLRFTDNNLHLVRLCINGSRHRNMDGTIVGPNHIHIYQYHDGQVEGYAYELNEFPFDATSELETTVSKFLEFVNIQKGGTLV